jgi:SPP1 family holin
MKRKISKGTITRTACLILAIINSGLAIFGKSPLPIESETVTEVISFIFTTVASLVAWWKDNDITQKALERKANS